MKKLQNISDIRRFFHRNDMPIYFVSATPFNLLGMDEWVRRFTFINYIDCFDGAHPHVFIPSERSHEQFEGIEDITNYLLAHPEVEEYVRSHAPKGKKRGNAAFLFFDEKTEELCEKLGLEVVFPSADLRTRIDDKLMTTRIGNEAGVKSVPNALAPVKSWSDLRAVAEENGLGDKLVVQTPFGDSGHTTFFISNQREYQKYADEIESEKEVKVMKRVRVRGSALEACVTKHGTIVGPLMTELVGFKELTPYKGGWCGNEVFADAFPQKVRTYARKAAFKIGEALRKKKYRGYFEIDFLTDLETGDVYLGEINPRITGASSMTNLATFAHADAPLFLFHLLEYMKVPYELDVEELNKRWATSENIDSWSQLVIKHTEENVELIRQAPKSGVWQLEDDGSVTFVRSQTHRRTVQRSDRAFFLRIAGEGDWFYEGADLGILVMPGRQMTDNFKLTSRSKKWIQGIRDQYSARPPRGAEKETAAMVAESSHFKLL
ncbi:MAG: biotin carboxylase [Thermoanaerobaculia bacterium]|nr:biotin carboxylase [Thermoanaerobaculia bacterium]